MNMLFRTPISFRQAHDIPIRILALIGDAVFNLYERERQISEVSTVKQMHRRVSSRVNAAYQADLLNLIKDELRAEELDLVRQARNTRPANSRKSGQAILRLSTAFEALLGYLYLTDFNRLKDVLALTICSDHTAPADSILKDKL